MQRFSFCQGDRIVSKTWLKIETPKASRENRVGMSYPRQLITRGLGASVSEIKMHFNRKKNPAAGESLVNWRELDLKSSRPTAFFLSRTYGTT